MDYDLHQAFLFEKDFSDNIIYQYKESRRAGKFAEIPSFLHDEIKEWFQTKGIAKLYKHQEEAIRSIIQEKKNTIISTGVASGKSLCYQIPILNEMIKNPSQRALLLFPTKALTQDQYLSFSTISTEIKAPNNILLGAYDGDTSSSLRNKIRNQANIIFSNPDMFHLGILPHHTAWRTFFENLSYIVIDEIHTYRGIFGSHFCNVLRRIMRICKHYGNKPILIGTSATLSNTKDFCEMLLESKVNIIEEDTAPKGQKKYLLYNPPIVNKELGIRKNAILETTRIASFATFHNVQTLIFSQSRRNVELILSYLQKTGQKEIMAYRGGYLASERREIEQKLKNKGVQTVVSTNALELGIDVGSLDVVIIHGFPGSISSFRQQAGRAGRTQRDSLVIFVATSGLMEQFLVKNPTYLFHSQNEQARINPNNPFILLKHIQCALFEKPFSTTEGFGSLPSSALSEYLTYLQQTNEAILEEDTVFWRSSAYPAHEVNLRTVTDGKFLIQKEKNVIAEVDSGSAFWMVHPRAIYIHQGETFYVKKLDFLKQIAFVEDFDGDYYTQAQINTEFELLEKKNANKNHKITKNHGMLKVISQVKGFKKLKWKTHENLGYEELQLPETELITEASWITFGNEFIEEMSSQNKWNNFKNKYGKEWKKTTENIRKRDHFRCQHCGIEELSKAHDVHHKIPFKKCKNPNEANKESNLITLCSACHKKAEKSLKIQSGLSGIAYILKHLLPIFMMCDREDVRVHASEQLKFEQNAPSIIVFDAVPGGIGIAKAFYEKYEALFRKAVAVIQSCNCDDGCPACVGPTAEHGDGAKLLTLEILKMLLDRD